MFRQRKLTLNTPYNKINKVLWQNKRMNSQQLTENVQLKTHVHQLQRRVKDYTSLGQLNKNIVKKYEKLTQTYKRQTSLITDIKNQIQQRKYQQLKSTVKKIQNKLNLTATKALKLQKKLKILIRKEDKNENNFVQTIQDQDGIQNLENEKNELDKNLQKKQKQLFQIESRNKELNRQLLNLLTIKNKLKEEAKQHDKKMLKQNKHIKQPTEIID